MSCKTTAIHHEIHRSLDHAKEQLNQLFTAQADEHNRVCAGNETTYAELERHKQTIRDLRDMVERRDEQARLDGKELERLRESVKQADALLFKERKELDRLRALDANAKKRGEVYKRADELMLKGYAIVHGLSADGTMARCTIRRPVGRVVARAERKTRIEALTAVLDYVALVIAPPPRVAVDPASVAIPADFYAERDRHSPPVAFGTTVRVTMRPGHERRAPPGIVRYYRQCEGFEGSEHWFNSDVGPAAHACGSAALSVATWRVHNMAEAPAVGTPVLLVLEHRRNVKGRYLFRSGSDALTFRVDGEQLNRIYHPTDDSYSVKEWYIDHAALYGAK